MRCSNFHLPSQVNKHRIWGVCGFYGNYSLALSTSIYFLSLAFGIKYFFLTNGFLLSFGNENKNKIECIWVSDARLKGNGISKCCTTFVLQDIMVTIYATKVVITLNLFKIPAGVLLYVSHVLLADCFKTLALNPPFRLPYGSHRTFFHYIALLSIRKSDIDTCLIYLVSFFI